MGNIPIFKDEDVIRAYIKEKLESNFDDFTIEEIIELTKTPNYKDFSNSFIITFNTNQLITFNRTENIAYNISDAVKSQLQNFLSKTYVKKLKYK